ncbi:MAG: hypothetical protein GY926_08565 [bacterium]|nr:hypothetical protein [bacterium]
MRTFSRLLIVAAVASATLVAIPAAQAANPGGSFTDDDQNIHEGYIEAIAAAGITTGCNPPFNSEYCPNRVVTRGQMAAFLVRALDLTSDGGKDWFTDDGDSIFESDINKLAAAGVTSGCGDGKFCPDRSLTRAEMASFLVRGYGYPSTSTDSFVDDESSIHEDAINRLRKAGVTAGCNPPVNSRYCPNSLLRRDEMATLIGRAEKLVPMNPPPRFEEVDIDKHVYPGDDIGDLAKDSPEGTVFMIHGTHNRQTIKPRDGQQFIGANDAVLDGNDTTDYAFDGSADDVLLRNLEIRNYDSNKQRGAIDADGGDWTVEGCDIHHNAAVGVRLSSGTPTVRFNNIHHNYQLGINVPHSVNGLIENNEVAYNNFEQDYNWGFEAGGSKFWSTTNLTVRGNWTHHNHGPGFWTDHDNIGIIYENNLVEHNFANGLFHEIGYDGIIRNNTIRYNGFGHAQWLWGGGIVIASSQGVEIYGNYLEGNHNGITITQQDRGSGEYGKYLAQNNYVHDNVIVDSGLSGAAQDIGSQAIYEPGNNRWENNDYVGDVDWNWEAHTHSFSGWQDIGHDTTGSYTP